MKILGIESAANVASVAVIDDDKVVAEYTTDYKKTHSQTLMPMIDQMLKMVDMPVSSIDAIAVSKGPGSYTGLRIGAASAKAMAVALERPLVPVSTLEAMAYNILYVDGIICPIMDARANRVYKGIYKCTGENKDNIEALTEPRIIEIDKLIEELNTKNEHIYLLGDGVNAYKENILSNLKSKYTLAAPSLCKSRAALVALLGKKNLEKGLVADDSWAPTYLQKSQAEREREASGAEA